jgi:C4-dicarboxylate transporter, DctM subunit
LSSLSSFFSRMPIGFVMAFVGFVGFVYLKGFDASLGLVKIVPYRTFANYDVSVIPLFVLMGAFCFHSRISRDLYEAVHKWLGQLRGGLAMTTVVACAAFAAISGSSLATAATMGTVALPEMKRYKYDTALATGAVAAGGTIGILIPPSVVLVLYGIITEQSIGKLFLAGFIPGIMEAGFYMLTIYILCKHNPSLAPPGPRIGFIEKLVSAKDVWVVLALFLLVIGGIYFGIFTPTEAAGVSAFGAFLFGVARRRLGWRAFRQSLAETGKTTAMIFVIILGAMVLGYFLAVSRLPFELADIISRMEINRYIIFAIILLIYIALGCVMDSMAMMLLITPIFFPLVTGMMGFDPIWFGIITVRVCEIGLITPPVGLNVYIIQGISGGIPMQTIFRGILPFLIADLCQVALLIGVPQVVLFLPGPMK